MGLLRWYRRLTMTRVKSLECMVWIMSAFIVTFILVSMGKLHNEFGREQGSSLKMHPEGRRVLSVQHASKDKMPVRVKRQQVNENSRFYAEEPRASDGHQMVHSDNHAGIADVKYDKQINSEDTDMGYADTVGLEDNTNDLSHFEELDGFNYVANKEKHEADLKLSNNIRVAGGDVVVDQNSQVDRFVQRDHVDPNSIDTNDANTWRKDSHHNGRDSDGKKLHENVPSDREADFHREDAEDMTLHEQQLLEHNIIQHKPIIPNLPPEDDQYDSHLGNSQSNVQPQQYFYQRDNRPVKSRAVKKSFGSRVQFYAPNRDGLKDKEIRPQKQMKYGSPNNEARNIEHDSSKLNSNSFQNVGGGHNMQQSNLFESKPRDFEQYPNQGQVQQFSQNTGQLQQSEIQGNVQFVDNLIQQQSQYRKVNQDDFTNLKPKKRKKKKKRGSKRNDESTNNTVIFESHRQGQFNHVNNVQSAFQPTQKSSVLSIYMKPNGRLGNQMFEIASLYGIARRTGRKPFMSKYSDIYQIFTHANRTIAMGEASEDLGVLFEEKPGRFSGDLFSLPPTNLVLCCYFQSWKYFEGYQSNIRRMFHFRGKIRKLARTVINKAKHVYLTQLTDQVSKFGNTQSLTYIGVHVRRGDLQLEHHLRRGYKPAPLNYFHKAMDYYRQHYPNTIFLVTSDEIEWCKVKLGSSDVFFVEGQHEAVDLAVLSMTNHTVISVGTFSWWAGWLAGGQVIYYRNWPTKNSEVAQQYEHGDYFLPKWKPMSD